MKFKKICMLMLAFLLLAGIPVYAAPYMSYTYDYWNVEVPSPHAYVPDKVITGLDVGVGQLKTPHDIFVDDNGHVYVLDTGNNRIIHLDSEWNLVRVISQFDNNGKTERFNVPRGIHVNSNGDIYVADRENGRIVVLDKDANLKMLVTSPAEDQPELFTSDFRFRPDKLAVDKYGTIYVISMGVYDGIMEFDEFGDFQGFQGAPTVNPTLADYIWRLISTKAQRARMKLFLPVEHSNIAVDKDGFVYATAIGGEIEEQERIRRLNTAGKDVLRRIETAPPIGDYIGNPSIFVDVVPRENGIYSILDRQRGRIFTYDANGSLLYAFGTLGDVDGAFRNPVAIAEKDGHLLVVDAIKNSVTVFRPTEYKEMIHNAVAYYDNGFYDEAAELWQKILERNSNYDLAYTGIGRALLMQGDYAGAMYNFKLANNRVEYSEAFKLYRKSVIEDYFGLILFLVAALIIYLLIITSKETEVDIAEAKAKVAATYAEVKEWEAMPKRPFKIKVRRLLRALQYSFKVIVSPFEGFWDLKHEARGNLSAALTILAGVVVTYLYMLQSTGFIFNEQNPRTLNIITEAVSIIIPFFLWAGINWSLTTLMNGKGSFKDIVIASAYALVPFILINVPLTFISNYLSADEGAFYYLFLAISLIWSIGLLFFGTMVIHDYSLPGTIFVTLLILVGIGIALFIVLLFLDIIFQLFGFIQEVYNEFVFRL